MDLGSLRRGSAIPSTAFEYEVPILCSRRRFRLSILLSDRKPRIDHGVYTDRLGIGMRSCSLEAASWLQDL